MIKKFKFILLFYLLTNISNYSKSNENFFDKGLEFYNEKTQLELA